MPQAREHADNAAKQRAYRQRQAEARRTEREAKGLPTAAPIPTMPSNARWITMAAHARETLTTMQAEMQAYYDERSEQWQDSEKGEDFQRRLDALESVLSEMDALDER